MLFISRYLLMDIPKKVNKRKKLLARSLDFVPVIGPFLMMIGYLCWMDLISRQHFQRVSWKWFGFLGSAIFTLIVNIFFFGKVLQVAWYISFPYDLTETSITVILCAIAWYTCHAIFLWIDLFQDSEERLAKKVPLIRKWKEKQDGDEE